MGTYTLGAFCPGSACSRPSTNSTRLRVACAAHREARAASVGSSQYVGPVPSSSPAYRLSVHPSASSSTHASCRFSSVFLSLPLRPDRLATSAFPALSYIPSILPACTCASSSSCFFARPGPIYAPEVPGPRLLFIGSPSAWLPIFCWPSFSCAFFIGWPWTFGLRFAIGGVIRD